jgi:hypothetical protein
MNLQARLKGGRVGKGRRVGTAYRESRHSPSMLLAGFVSIGVEQGARISNTVMFRKVKKEIFVDVRL